ncbi:MAG: MYXO-CTERM sorting domain-containing protein [Polyangiaceae bacterium]
MVDLDREYDGTFEERLTGKSFEVNYPEPGRYVVRVRVTDSSGKEAGALATLLATQGGPEPEPEPEPETPDPGPTRFGGLAATGGGGCTSAPGGGADARWLGLAAAALALGARRRRR